MSRRLFDDLVVSRDGGARLRSVRMLPLSVALHGMAVASLAMLSVDAVTDARVRASRVIFHSSPRPLASPASAGVARPRASDSAVTTGLSAVPAVPVSLDPPAIETTAGQFADPPRTGPICLVGCQPAASGRGDEGDRSGSGGTPDGPGPPRRVGGEIEEPRKIQGAAPLYPELARRAGVQGVVVLECTIATGGRVTDLRVVSGHPLLNEAALDAVRQWVYTPTRLNGHPVRVIMTVTVRFKLGPKG